MTEANKLFEELCGIKVGSTVRLNPDADLASKEYLSDSYKVDLLWLPVSAPAIRAYIKGDGKAYAWGMFTSMDNPGFSTAITLDNILK